MTEVTDQKNGGPLILGDAHVEREKVQQRHEVLGVSTEPDPTASLFRTHTHTHSLSLSHSHSPWRTQIVEEEQEAGTWVWTRPDLD